MISYAKKAKFPVKKDIKTNAFKTIKIGTNTISSKF